MMKKSPTLRFAALAALLFTSSALADSRRDREIEAEARGSYAFSRVLQNAIRVEVRNGVATLTGRVRDLDQALLAEDTVAGIAGVRKVDNRVQQDPAAPEGSDEWLAVKVRSRLVTKRDVDLSNWNLHVKEGVVIVRGGVATPEQKRAAEAYIRQVAGVRDVRNELVVGGVAGGGDADFTPAAATGAGQPTGRDHVGARDRAAMASEIEDTSITVQVKYQLMANRATRHLKPRVDTDEGRVTIHGEAATAAEKDAVTRLAQRVRGVVGVANEMTVREP